MSEELKQEPKRAPTAEERIQMATLEREFQAIKRALKPRSKSELIRMLFDLHLRSKHFEELSKGLENKEQNKEGVSNEIAAS